MRAFVLAVVLAAGCGDPTAGGFCKTTCDCDDPNAPVRCPGEWICSSQGTCQYLCRDFCDAATPCPDGQRCRPNGSTCTARPAECP